MSFLILIVDDSAEDRAAIQIFILEAGEAEEIDFRFVECANGADGLAAFRSETPDCILLDHNLPDMDGMEFLDRLKDGSASLPVPVVILTGSEDGSLATEALRAGAQEYLRKRSLGPEVLFRAVKSAQDRFRLFDLREMADVRAALASSQAALASSRAETRAGLADLLASAVALASSQTETKQGLASLLVSAAALAASRAETQDGLTDLVASAEALSASRTETQDGQAELVASIVVNKALRLANALLVDGDAAIRASEARLREALATRQTELERLVAERTTALVAAEARFRGIFDSQLQFISLLDPDGTVIEMNHTALEACALTRADVVGRPFWETDWWSVEQRPRVRQDIAMAAAGGAVRSEVEISTSQDQGRGIWIDLSLKPVRDPINGAITWIIAEGHDLTEKRDLAVRLAQAEKMQALGQLAAGIAHDFNNILQVVSGSAALIEQRPSDLARTSHLAGSIIKAADRGMSITQRLLAFARRGELRPETIATRELVEGVCDVLAHTLGATITVRASIQPGTPALIADRAQLETAMINLGTNARDAMPSGGLLTLSAEAEQIPEGVPNSAGLAPGDYIRLTVSDTGTGMDAATLARVSEPFFTTKPPGKGTGLGVAMVKGFAEQSGGRLLITSTPGAGTNVAVWLRQATEIVSRSAEAATGIQNPISPSYGRILVVDDDDLVREILAAQLEAEGFATLVAASGQEALALIAAGERVDVLVSDLSMPGMDGGTTIRLARAMRPDLPCFLLTGYVGDGAALSTEHTFTLVRKPITGSALKAQLMGALHARSAFT